MKKSILILFNLLMFCSLVKTQDYRSVFENDYWRYYVDVGDFVKKSITEDPYNLATGRFLDYMYSVKDTLINDKAYLCFQRFEGLSFARETEDKSQVYCLDEENNEHLVYDMNLNVGDTFAFPVTIDLWAAGAWWILWDSTMVVDSIAYIANRKVIYFNYYLVYGPYSHQFRFIEGIGSTFGIYYPNKGWKQDISYKYNILYKSFSKDNLTYEFGIIYSGANEIEKEPKVTIFPNPCSHYIEISGFNDNEKPGYAIIDLYGKTIEKGRVSTNKLNVSFLPPGVYLLQIESSEKNSKSIKFMKQ